jgi:hypothetical protein
MFAHTSRESTIVDPRRSAYTWPMTQRYDIFFAAKLVEGFDEATVRANVGKLFKANEEALQKLFSGKPQLIKRGVDKAAAIKYKSALQKAGGVALIRAHVETPTGAAKPAPAPVASAPIEDEQLPSSADIKPAAPAAEPALSMADRIAAMTAEPAPAAATATATAAAAAPVATAFGEGISLAPTGSSVLNEDEREAHVELEIDTSAFHLSSEQDAPVVAEAEPAPPAPDVSHLSMGAVGEEIPHLETIEELLDPDVSHLSMGEPGEEIPRLVEAQELVDPDISGLELAPEGSEVLEPEYKKVDEAKAPNTEHLSLEP